MSKIFKKLSILFVITLFFLGCQEEKQKEFKIGFVAGLSGKYSSLGISIRDGFLLAFEEIGYNINGTKIVIVQKDDKQNEEVAKKAINSFIDQDIKLIVGNGTSSMTAISIPIVNKHKDMLLISATASSSDFTAKNDNFLRIQVEQSKKKYHTLVQYIKKKGYKKIFFIYDSNNLKYSKGYDVIFQDLMVENGGKAFVKKVDLNNPYEKILKEIKSVENDLILVVGNSIDSANIIQYLRINNINTPVVGTGWAKTMDFISHGGKAVEGVFFSTGYDDKSKDKAFLEFVEKFKAKYKRQPSVFAAQGHELAQILIQNLRNSFDMTTLKQRILDIKRYNGLQGDIIFDNNGDVFREYFIMEVKNKEYVKIDYKDEI